MNIKKKYIVYVLLITSLGCENREDDAKKSEDILSFDQTQIDLMGVTFSYVKQDSFDYYHEVQGRIDIPPQSKVFLTLPIKVSVESIKIYQGSKVKKGQILASFQHPDFSAMQLKYIQLSAYEDQLYQEFVRQKELSEQEVGALKTFEIAQANYKAASAECKSLEELLIKTGVDLVSIKDGKIQQNIYIRSPIDGIITNLPINIGSILEPNTKAIELMDGSHLHIELFLLEKDLEFIKPEQKLLFKTFANDEWQHSTIYKIESTVNPQSGVVIAHCHLDKPIHEVKPGQLVEAKVLANRSFGLKVNSRSIIRANDSSYIIYTENIEKEPFKMILEPIQIESESDGFTLVNLIVNGNKEVKYVVDSAAFKVFAALKFSYED